MNINGKSLAEDVYESLPKMRLKLGILVGDMNPVVESFVRIKERIARRLNVALIRVSLTPTATAVDVIAAVQEIAKSTDGIILQLPLQSTVNIDDVLVVIPPHKDVDGISPHPMVRPPVAGAVEEILSVAGVDPRGKSAVVVGSGRLVGKPSAELLRERGANVTVLDRGDSLEPLKYADIVVLGAGEPGLVRPEHLKPGVVLIDAGTSETGGKVRGDADPACASVASVFTPVPGGVGPIAVAMIFKNLSILAERARR